MNITIEIFEFVNSVSVYLHRVEMVRVNGVHFSRIFPFGGNFSVFYRMLYWLMCLLSSAYRYVKIGLTEAAVNNIGCLF